MFERIPHSLSVVNVLRNPDHPNSWRTSQFTTGSERSKEPWLSSCLKEIHWNSHLLPVVINLRALDHPFTMISGIQTTNQGYKQYSVYLKYMINLVYISNIWLIHFTTNLNMIDLVYISNIWCIFYHQSKCDKSGVYIYISFFLWLYFPPILYIPFKW